MRTDYQLCKYLPLPDLRNLSSGLRVSKKWVEDHRSFQVKQTVRLLSNLAAHMLRPANGYSLQL